MMRRILGQQAAHQAGAVARGWPGHLKCVCVCVSSQGRTAETTTCNIVAPCHLWSGRLNTQQNLAIWQLAVLHCGSLPKCSSESNPATRSPTATASTVSQGCVSDETAGSLMPNLGTGLVCKWLTTMDGNLRWRQQGRAGGRGSTMLGRLPRPQPRMLTDTAARTAARARRHGCSQNLLLGAGWA